jgi:hypothetical protein
MNLNFRSLASVAAFLFLSLALIWMFAPELALSSWGVAFSSEVGLVARRAAALSAWIGVMLFAARNSEPSPSRSALVAGLVMTCLTLAILGVFELASGHAKVGILGAVFIEIALALAFLTVRFKELADRSAATGSENAFHKT